MAILLIAVGIWILMTVEKPVEYPGGQVAPGTFHIEKSDLKWKTDDEALKGAISTMHELTKAIVASTDPSNMLAKSNAEILGGAVDALKVAMANLVPGRMKGNEVQLRATANAIIRARAGIKTVQAFGYMEAPTSVSIINDILDHAVDDVSKAVEETAKVIGKSASKAAEAGGKIAGGALGGLLNGIGLVGVAAIGLGLYLWLRLR